MTQPTGIKNSSLHFRSHISWRELGHRAGESRPFFFPISLKTVVSGCPHTSPSSEALRSMTLFQVQVFSLPLYVLLSRGGVRYALLWNQGHCLDLTLSDRNSEDRTQSHLLLVRESTVLIGENLYELQRSLQNCICESVVRLESHRWIFLESFQVKGTPACVCQVTKNSTPKQMHPEKQVPLN